MTITYDEATNLAFFNHQLEERDSIIHKPIVDYTWSRDIKVKNVPLSTEFTSFLRSDFRGNGSLAQGSIPWISQDTTEFSTVSISLSKEVTPVRLAGQIITYSQIELEKAQRLGIALESEKLDALRNLYQLGIDKMVYMGDSLLDTDSHKCRGLFNNEYVETNFKTDAAKTIAESTPDEIVALMNDLILKVWSQTGYTRMPDTILMPPQIYATLYNTKYSSNAETTVMTYLKRNCLGGSSITFNPSRWAAMAGSDKGGRIIAYINDINHVRFSMAPIKSYTSYIDQGFRYNRSYVWALGETEFVRPEGCAYLDKVSSPVVLTTMSAPATMSAAKASTAKVTTKA